MSYVALVSRCTHKHQCLVCNSDFPWLVQEENMDRVCYFEETMSLFPGTHVGLVAK